MISFRTASLSDLKLLQHWDRQPHVIASNPNDQWDWEPDLELDVDWQKILIAELDGRPIGVIQIIDPPARKPIIGVKLRKTVGLLISDRRRKRFEQRLRN